MEDDLITEALDYNTAFMLMLGNKDLSLYYNWQDCFHTLVMNQSKCLARALKILAQKRSKILEEEDKEDE
jgi:hypothetical protein